MTARWRSRVTAFSAVLLLVLAPGVAEAQAPAGRVRAQGQDVTPQQAPPSVTAPDLLRDYREEMRKFVQAISAFARGHRRNFMVVPQNGLDLLVKAEEGDETRKAPARTYMRSIDGVLVEALFYGWPEFDKPTPPERQESLLPLTDLAKESGLRVLVMDYGKTPRVVEDSYRRNAAKGYASLVAHARGVNLTALPPYPRDPFNANSSSVVTLRSVSNFAYLRDSSGFGREDEFALKLHATNFDMVVVDPFHRAGEPLTKQAVETLKYKNLGARRLVLAYLNIGAAESYRYYWNPRWREGSPVWISAPHPGNPDVYFVEYWRPEWQKIVTGDVQSYVYGAIDQGYDGVVLDGVEAYRFFEGGSEAVQALP